MTTSLPSCLPCILCQTSMTFILVVTFYIFWYSWLSGRGRSKSLNAKVNHTLNLTSIHHILPSLCTQCKLATCYLDDIWYKSLPLSATVWAKHLRTHVDTADAAMLDLTPTAFACTIRAQDPFLWFWFWFCRECFCFCRELFAFAVTFFILPCAFWFCRE